MRTKASSKSNMRFLKGNVVFFALLLLAIMLFAYYALKGMDSAGDNSFSCKVSFAKNYTGGECRVFIGDSLLYAGDPCGADTVIEMRRYATEKSKVSLYTSQSLLRIVADGDTVQRALQGDREFVIESAGGKITVSALEK
jgi:hypothetical protein